MGGERGSVTLQALGLIAGALVVLSGCEVGPNFVRPHASVAQHWIDDPADSAPAATDTAAWWQLFDDPTLDELIDTAYHNNLSLQVAGGAHPAGTGATEGRRSANSSRSSRRSAAEVQHQRQSQSTLLAPGLDPILRHQPGRAERQLGTGLLGQVPARHRG